MDGSTISSAWPTRQDADPRTRRSRFAAAPFERSRKIVRTERCCSELRLPRAQITASSQYRAETRGGLLERLRTRAPLTERGGGDLHVATELRHRPQHVVDRQRLLPDVGRDVLRVLGGLADRVA